MRGGVTRGTGTQEERESKEECVQVLSPDFVFSFSQLVCQQEALGSSWIRPSVRGLAADPENETTHSHKHTHTHT